MALDDLITELERRCPGCSFRVETDPPKIRIVEYSRRFTVDLVESGETAKRWLEIEIERHPTDKILPLQPDERYYVLCDCCGPTMLGYGAYRDQMGQPDIPWSCPVCGGPALFDTETYENYQER